MIDLVFNNFTKQKKYGADFFKKIIKEAGRHTSLDKESIGLSINIVSKAKICSLNKKYRNKDKATDVLAFPLWESNFHKKNLPPYKNKNYDAIIELGDIFICPEVAGDSEIKFLTVHGFLHLLGYDHEKSKKEEMEMFQLQNKILKSVKNR